MRTLKLTLIAIVTSVALAFPSSAGAGTKTLVGTDGPGFTITMNKKTVKAGRYVIIIRDRSPIHNFHLTGPGVNKSTSVGAKQTVKWTVTLQAGTYTFRSDAHKTLRGTLKVS